MKNNKQQLSEEDLFKLVEFASSVIMKVEAEGFKKYLNGLLKAHLPVEYEIVVEDRMKWFTYVLRLVFTCPSFLDKPAGFEWVAKQFRQILGYRKVDPDFERDFWKAMDDVRGTLRPAKRPPRKDKDHARYFQICCFMQNEGLSKTSAVGKLAEEEVRFRTKQSKAHPVDQVINKKKEIWEAVKRVEQNQQELKQLRTKWGLGPD